MKKPLCRAPQRLSALGRRLVHFICTIGMVVGFLCFTSVTYAQSVSEEVKSRLVQQGNLLSNYDRVSLLTSAREKYDTLFRYLAEAQESICLEYFNIRNDSVGGVLMRLLGQRAAAGVDVRVVIDGYGNYKNPSPWTDDQLDSLEERGVRVKIFDRFRFPYLAHLAHRDHRKIAVVDGKYVFSGGMNIADYYLTGTKRSGPWRDMHFVMQGDVARVYAQIFERMWCRLSGECADTLTRYEHVADSGNVVVVNREPKKLSKRMRKAYVTCIAGACEEIRIVNPYLTNVRSIRRALLAAHRRGVRVRMMVSATGDEPLTPDVIAIEMRKMMRKGCEVYYYEGGFHHSKIMTVDNTFCTIGSANLDGRSMLFDYEANAFLFDVEVTALLDASFDADLQHSELLTPKTFRRRFSAKQRLAGRIFHPVNRLF